MTLRILIVGGGITGLVLARGLGQRGLHAEIVERSAEWTDGGTGLYLPGKGTGTTCGFARSGHHLRRV